MCFKNDGHVIVDLLLLLDAFDFTLAPPTPVTRRSLNRYFCVFVFSSLSLCSWMSACCVTVSVCVCVCMCVCVCVCERERERERERKCVRACVHLCAYVFLVSHTSFWLVIAFSPDIKYSCDRMTSSKTVHALCSTCLLTFPARWCRHHSNHWPTALQRRHRSVIPTFTPPVPTGRVTTVSSWPPRPR